MKRDEVLSRLEAYLDGELTPAEAHAVQQALQQDEVLRQQVRLRGRLNERVQQAYLATPCDVQQLEQTIRRQLDQAPVGSHRSRLVDRFRLPQYRAAVAACVVVVLVVAGTLLTERNGESRFIEQVALGQVDPAVYVHNHHHCVKLTRETSHKVPTEKLLPFFANEAALLQALQQFADNGYQLHSTEICRLQEGVYMAHLIYRSESGAPVSLYVTEDRLDPQQRDRVASLDLPLEVAHSCRDCRVYGCRLGAMRLVVVGRENAVVHTLYQTARARFAERVQDSATSA